MFGPKVWPLMFQRLPLRWLGIDVSTKTVSLLPWHFTARHLQHVFLDEASISKASTRGNSVWVGSAGTISCSKPRARMGRRAGGGFRRDRDIVAWLLLSLASL
jgi:hypothetical protein